MTPSWACFAAGDSVSTFMSGATVTMHDGCNIGPRPVSMSTRHIRHIPTGFIRSCQQNRGM